MIVSALTRAGVLAALACSALGAQQPGHGAAPVAALRRIDATAGSPADRTARVLDMFGTRAPSLLAEMSMTRWDTLVAVARRQGLEMGTSSDALEWDLPLLRLWMNSDRSRQDRDGPVWQGRGVTMALSGGGAVRWRWLSLAVRPVAFASQNAVFTPDPASTSPGTLRDPAWGALVDLPYRMGTDVFTAWHPGESFVRVGGQRVGVGVTTASAHWGPAERFPLVLSTEAGGFPRAFLHVTDVPVGVGRLHGQWLFGLLDVSREANVAADDRSRAASAVAVSVTPRWMPGVEIGGARFFHVRRQPGSIPWSSATWPFTGLIKAGSRADPDRSANQLASIFARIAPPGARVALYGEYYREDHNSDVRDLIAEPDHDNAYVIGLKRAWCAGADLFAFTLERANGRITHLARVREQGPIGLHGILLEGHTYRGQSLGSSALIGGGGFHVSMDRVGQQRSQFAEIELLGGPQSGEGGTWHGKAYGETRVGAGADWRQGSHWLGGGAWLGMIRGDRTRASLTLAARVR